MEELENCSKFLLSKSVDLFIIIILLFILFQNDLFTQ